MYPFLHPDNAAKVSIRFIDIVNDPSTSSNFKQILSLCGFVIVTDVLSAEEIATAQEYWAKDLQCIMDIEASKDKILAASVYQDPVHTWPSKVPLGQPVEFGLAQGQLAWYIRRNSNIRHCFEIVHDTEHLCVGTDSIMFSREPPPKLRKSWGHVDYHRDLIHHECFQSIVYLMDTEEESSTTVVWPGSHLSHFDTVMEANAPRLFSTIPASMVPEYEANAVRLKIPKGAMVLWNSKLVHQGHNWGRRLAVPVCFEPSVLRTREVLQLKQELVENGMSGTHWAAIFHTHAKTRAKGNKPKELQRDVGPFRLHHRAHLHLLDESGFLKDDYAALL
ncbi:hypothetical protein THRCLA_07134 [Thraustotheca clavata]|uniref:Phytanoyl-CoA dioxygenase n=1 Tax=Thraustotheca clavata TaxID=74557 RepID=A0A1V9ZFW9_9STRA|nr:hypothetical protein THRCLA_07134 [Thraustotheca clavata]